MKICIIGHFGGDKEFNDGQTIKTKEIYGYLMKNSLRIETVDTYFLKRKPFKVFSKIKCGIANNDAIILIVSSRGYRLIARFLVKMSKKYNKKVFDFVIGGMRYKLFDKKPSMKSVAMGFTKIYVETNRMKEEYMKRGIKNVDVVPNFKDLKQFPAKKDYIKSNELKACIFSRIIKEKGISDAVEAVSIANGKNDGVEYSLDIYGSVSDEYSNEFYDLLSKNKAFVRYEGVADSKKSSEVINRHDVLLFPTYWKGEGFPGTIIDAFFAATPVIATDWNDNFEILEDGKNGIKIKIKSPNEIADAMEKIAHDKKYLAVMSSESCEEAKNYRPEEAMRPFMFDLGYTDEK